MADDGWCSVAKKTVPRKRAEQAQKLSTGTVYTDPSSAYTRNATSRPSWALDDEFMMFKCKTTDCPDPRGHISEHCPYAHDKRRRNPKIYKYFPVACPYAPSGKDERPCDLGDACFFAHNGIERGLHPYYYRSTPCDKKPFCERCICFFDHGDTGSKLRTSDFSFFPSEQAFQKQEARRSHADRSRSAPNKERDAKWRVQRMLAKEFVSGKGNSIHYEKEHGRRQHQAPAQGVAADQHAMHTAAAAAGVNRVQQQQGRTPTMVSKGGAVAAPATPELAAAPPPAAAVANYHHHHHQQQYGQHHQQQRQQYGQHQQYRHEYQQQQAVAAAPQHNGGSADSGGGDGGGGGGALDLDDLLGMLLPPGDEEEEEQGAQQQPQQSVGERRQGQQQQLVPAAAPALGASQAVAASGARLRVELINGQPIELDRVPGEMVAGLAHRAAILGGLDPGSGCLRLLHRNALLEVGAEVDACVVPGERLRLIPVYK